LPLDHTDRRSGGTLTYAEHPRRIEGHLAISSTPTRGFSNPPEVLRAFTQVVGIFERRTAVHRRAGKPSFGHARARNQDNSNPADTGPSRRSVHAEAEAERSTGPGRSHPGRQEPSGLSRSRWRWRWPARRGRRRGNARTRRPGSSSGLPRSRSSVSGSSRPASQGCVEKKRKPQDESTSSTRRQQYRETAGQQATPTLRKQINQALFARGPLVAEPPRSGSSSTSRPTLCQRKLV